MEEKNKNELSNADTKSGKHLVRKKQSKLKRTVSAVYLGLALCMVVVMAVSFSSTKNSIKDGMDKLEDISISMPDISVPDISMPLQKPPVDSSVPEDNPVHGTQSGVDDTVIKPEDSSIEITKPSYVRPVIGEVLKGHSLDTLVFSQTMQDFRIHKGVDFAAEVGTTVCAYTDGKVLRVENTPFMGVTVEIEHEADVRSVYCNLHKDVKVKVGDTVVAGDAIGVVGNTALAEVADNPHLHFEIWMGEDCLNPLDQFSDIKE